jgi:hypothetical protein
VFERYTEAARRLLFDARNEAAQCGTLIVETEHFLLAHLKLAQSPDTDSVWRRLLPPRKDVPGIIENEVRAALPSLPSTDEKESAFSHAMKRVLAYGAEAAEQLHEQSIDAGHCLLGLLREEECLASQILRRNGITTERVWREMGGSDLAPLPRATRETLNALVASLPEGAIEHAHRMLERMQVWPPVPPPRPGPPLRGGMGGGMGSGMGVGVSWMTDSEGKVRDGNFSSSRIEDGARVSETRRFIEGYEINTLERVRIDREKKLLSWSMKILGPKREHHLDIDFEI